VLQPAITHTVTVQQLARWANGSAVNPDEQIRKENPDWHRRVGWIRTNSTLPWALAPHGPQARRLFDILNRVYGERAAPTSGHLCGPRDLRCAKPSAAASAARLGRRASS
jgi:hypothetical protein